MATFNNMLLCLYHYDAIDRLVGRSEPKSHGRKFFYCRARQATEMQGLSHLTTFMHDEFLLAQHSDENRKRNTSLLATDQQNSVINAQQLQKPPSSAAYTPYGHRTSGNDVTSLPGFTGERADSLTGHFPLGQGHRWFNPVLMRFNSPDRLSPFGKGGLNSYAYCMGDPVNRTDPSGQKSILHRLFFAPKKRDLYLFKDVLFDMQPVTNAKQISPNITIFESIHKNKLRLTINGHGSEPRPDYGIASEMQREGKNGFGPRGLLRLLKKNNVDIEKYTYIRLRACNLADGHNSFAGRLARLTGKEVKAYSGITASLFFGDLPGVLLPTATEMGIAKQINYEPRYFIPWDTSRKIRQPKA